MTDAKRRDRAAAGIYCKQQRVVLTQDQRSLGFEWIDQAAASSAASFEPVTLSQGTVCRSTVRNDFIPICGIRHDEHSSRNIVEMCLFS